ncbi:hypothetical protein PG997_010545 [Apiospora hydei]|uniref:Uncharacterized protein n=1 Tax=Apiospora hydei TaxID=1337664 RepID=A0ABR1VXG4_9PEZI
MQHHQPSSLGHPSTASKDLHNRQRNASIINRQSSIVATSSNLPFLVIIDAASPRRSSINTSDAKQPGACTSRPVPYSTGSTHRALGRDLSSPRPSRLRSRGKEELARSPSVEPGATLSLHSDRVALHRRGPVCARISGSQRRAHRRLPATVHPLKLKGIFAHAPVHVHVHPSQIQSPTYHDDIDAPDDVRAKLPGRLARFSMTLSEPARLIIPSNTPSPLRARSRASGMVLDALRSLARATELSIYMVDEEASRAHLQPLCALLAAGRAAPLPPYTETARLFGGSGGCRWVDRTLSPPPPLPPLVDEDHSSLPPPRYDELGPGPPMPPISSQEARLARFSPRSESAESSAVLQRLTMLEVLVQAQAKQIEELLADNRQQKERIRECEVDIGAVRLAAERAHGRVEELELEMAVQRDDMERLDGEVQYCREFQEDEDLVEIVASTVSDRISDNVTDAVIDRIATRGLVARNISFSLGDE